MEKADKEYLRRLIDNTLKKYNDFAIDFHDSPEVKITYVATKKRFSVGLRCGMSGLAEMKRWHAKEAEKISRTCQYYNKIYRVDGKVAKVECYIGGHDRLSKTYIAYYEENTRYLFPLRGDRKDPVPRHIFVATVKDGNIHEEYHVDGKQIIYEKYGYSQKDRVDYYYINYVPEGKEPILGETEGYFLRQSMDFVETYAFTWWQNE